MPISVILSLGVVEIRFRWMLPAMVVLFGFVTVAELVAFELDGERLMTLLASLSMVAVVIQAAYRLQVVAYENWKRSDELATAARIDPLTGLPNRRQFTEDMQDVFDGHRPLAVAAVMIDVDRLKEYNDTYGHPAGDACLQRIATVLEAAAGGQSTQVYRLGGEEFAAVISTPSVADAEPVAEALVTAVTDANIPSATPEQPVTVSAGFTDIRPSDDHTTLLARADAALYQAKRAGRNRLVVDMSA